MKKLYLLLVLALLLTLSGCTDEAPTATDPKPKDETVEGTVDFEAFEEDTPDTGETDELPLSEDSSAQPTTPTVTPPTDGSDPVVNSPDQPDPPKSDPPVLPTPEENQKEEKPADLPDTDPPTREENSTPPVPPATDSEGYNSVIVKP